MAKKTQPKTEVAVNETSETQAIPLPPPVWPIEYGTGTNSPIPIMVFEGDSGTGKTTAIASLAPARLGESPRTAVFDTEQSWSNLASKMAIEHIDLNVKAAEYIKAGNSIPLARWKAFIYEKEILLNLIAAGQLPRLQVIGIDSGSDLRDGAREWLEENPTTFNRNHKYLGKEGYMHSWSDASRLFEMHLLELATVVETVAVATHRKEDFKTKQIKVDGFNIDRKAAMHLILFNETHVAEAKKANLKPCRWAYVKKQRTDNTYIDDDGELVVGELLPRKLISEAGKSYVALIRQYMRNPERDYGELNQFENEAEIDQSDKVDDDVVIKHHEIKLDDAKRGLAKRLMDDKVFATMQDIAAALDKLGIEIKLLDDVATAEKALRDFIAGETQQIAS